MARWSGVVRAGGIAALMLDLACGGKARDPADGNASVAGQPGATAGGSTGVTWGGSSGGPSGGASPEPRGNPVAGLALEDMFPWFDGSGASEFPPAGTDVQLVLAATGNPARGTLSTHNHIDLLSAVSTVSFSARASAPVKLLVSARRSVDGYDYFAERDAGKLWPVAAVDVDVDWQPYSIRIADMQPSADATAPGNPSFSVAFIVEHPEPVDVWIDEVMFE